MLSMRILRNMLTNVKNFYNMKYEDLARTFDIISSKNPTGILMDWAEHDEWGFELSDVDLTPSEVRQIAKIGWMLGSDSEYDEEEMKAWINPDEHTDEQLM